MKVSVTAALFLGSTVLVGCDRPTDNATDVTGAHGRYAGVGIYSPGPQWTKLADNQQATDPKTAKPVDDQAIIVVQDTMTGEVRACGYLTGQCVGMNPWKSTLPSDRRGPVSVTEHGAPASEAAQAVQPMGAATR